MALKPRLSLSYRNAASSMLVFRNRQTVCILYTLQSKSSITYLFSHSHKYANCKWISHTHKYAIASASVTLTGMQLQVYQSHLWVCNCKCTHETNAPSLFLSISQLCIKKIKKKKKCPQSFWPSESKTLYSPLKNTYISYRPPHSKALNPPLQNTDRHLWTAKHLLSSRQQNTEKHLLSSLKQNTYRHLWAAKHLLSSWQKNTYSPSLSTEKHLQV